MKRIKFHRKYRRHFLGLTVIVMLVVGNLGCSASSRDKSATEANINKIELIKHANTMSSFNELIKSSQPVLVDFYADWCAPCRMMAPILEQVAGNMEGKVKIVKVNVDKNRDAAAKYGIRSIPTLMLFQNGQVKWQGAGVIQADKIEQIVISNTK